MKKLIFLILIVLVFGFTGCEKNNTKENKIKTTYSENSENEDKKNSQDENEINKNQSENIQKKDVDISSVQDIISSVLYYMYENDQDYNTAVNEENLPNLAYSILNFYVGDDYFVMPSYEDGEEYTKISRDDANQYIRIATSNFRGQNLNDVVNKYSNSEIMYYLQKDDSYYLMPADGAPWVSTYIINAYKNNDGTYTAKIDAYFESNAGDHEFIAQYKITLVDNDASSKFKYRIYDIKKL